MKVGLPTTLFQKDTVENAIKKILKLHPDCIEIVFDIPHFPPDKRRKTEFKKIRKILADSGVECSVHSCFYELNLGSFYPQNRKFALNQAKKCIEFASLIEAKLVTIHPGYFPIRHDKKLWEEARKRFVEDLKQCLNFACKMGVILSLENIQSKYFFFYRLEDGLDLVKMVDGLKVTFDVGHAYICECEAKTRFPEKRIAKIVSGKLGKYISHVHLHDNFGVKDNHLVPGDGKINFKPIIDALKRINFSGQIIVEAWNPKKPVNFGFRSLKITKKILNF